MKFLTVKLFMVQYSLLENVYLICLNEMKNKYKHRE